MYVKDYMHTALTTVTPDTLLSTAYQIMTMRGERIRHLPVVTDRDVRRVGASDAPYMAEHELTYLLDKMRVQEVMTKDVVTVRGTTSLLESGQIFLQKKFGCLLVVRDNNRLEGIITVTDLLRAYVEQYDAGRRG